MKVDNVLISNEPSLPSVENISSKASAMIKKAHLSMKTQLQKVEETYYVLQNEVNALEKNLKVINDKLEKAGTNKSSSRTGRKSKKSSKLLNNEEIEDLIQESIPLKTKLKGKSEVIR